MQQTQVEIHLTSEEQRELRLAAEACGMSVDDLMKITLARLLSDAKKNREEVLLC